MDGPSFRFDGFELDTARFELRSGTAPIAIEPRAFDVLHYLLTNRDRVVSKEELLDTLWGDRFVGEAALTTAIRTARIAIGDNGQEQRLIRTVLRRGYQFAGTVAEVGSAAAPQPSASRISLPARMLESSGLGFAGRDHERVILRDACKEVIATGERQLVFVSGEAGIGKTTLCSVVASAAHRDGAAVLYGRCDDDLAIPYQPWRQILATLANQAPGAIAGRQDALGPLLQGTDTADIDSAAARFSLYTAVIEALEAVSTSGQLTLVVLDDLHWADVQTIALLRHFVQRTLATPVLVIATFRDTDIDAQHPLTDLLALAHREPGTTRVALPQLDGDEVLGLLEMLAGHEMDTNGLALSDALTSETDGNPFFVTEILRHLTETGAIRQDDAGRWTTPIDLGEHGLPISVREVVSRRIERLGSTTRRALDVAAVIGQEFELDLLAELLNESSAQAFERLIPAVENSLVTDTGGRFAFAHAIVAHTLYEELSPTARGLSHETVATKLEQRHGDADDRAGEIAHHWIHAVSPHRAAKAAEFAARAGNHAITHLAPDEAVIRYSQALELIADGDTAERCNILVGLGTAQRQAGVTGHRETLLDASRLAIELGDDDLLVRSALANNRGEVSQVGTVDHERIEMLRAAIAARPEGPDSAMLHAILSIELQDWAGSECRETATRAMELARAAADDRTTARVAPIAESSLLTPDTLDQREAWLHEGIAAADRAGDRMLRGRLAMAHHEIAVQRGDRDAMNRERRARDAFARRSPEPFVHWTNEQTTITHQFLDGDLEAAEASATVALEIGLASGQPEALNGYAGNLFQIRRTQDRLSEVATELEQVVTENSSISVFQAALAYLWCELERFHDARELTVDLDLSPGPTPQYWSTALMLWAEVCHSLGLAEPAARVASILEPWKDKVASTGGTTEGSIAHGLGRCLATIGRTDDAADAYELAVTVNQRLRAPLYVAQTQVAAAELFVTTDPSRSRSLLADARASVGHLEFAQIDRRINGVLAALHSDRSATQRGGPSLPSTAREDLS